MSSIYEMYETDVERETEGFVHQLSPEVSFTLARAGGANANFQKVMEKKTRPHRRAIQNDEMDAELANQLTRETFAETIILGWTGVTDKKGKKIPFNVENARKLLNDLPDLFIELRGAATSAANYRVQEIEEDLGN